MRKSNKLRSQTSINWSSLLNSNVRKKQTKSSKVPKPNFSAQTAAKSSPVSAFSRNKSVSKLALLRACEAHTLL